jgi:uncharacterized protein YqgV (UPF0045/DUF77 family)
MVEDKKLVNLAIQILPQGLDKSAAYAAVDAAIEAIDASGLKYVVCPFETVVEGTYKEVMAVLDSAQAATFAAGAKSVLVSMKLHRAAEGSELIGDKMAKYVAEPQA